jgi:hypothetical protein
MQCYFRLKIKLQIIEGKNAIKMAHNSNTNATATACNSTLDTLVLRKREKLRDIRKEWNYHPIQNQSHHHAGQFLPK